MTLLGQHPVQEPLPEPVRDRDPRHRCPLCGYRFAVGDEVCGHCGLGGGCEAVGCPHCGYRFPVESATLAWLKRLLGRIRVSVRGRR
ncbi:MAG: hypothetical protein ACE5HD_00050 [Acidobacteriota bacterium]